MVSVLLFLILGVLTVISWFLKDAPALYRALRVEESRSNNEKDIQREAFFRQLRGNELDEVFSYWTKFIVDMDKMVNEMNTKDGTNKMLKMQQQALMYGSDETIYVLSAMQQHLYSMDTVEKRISVKFGANDGDSKKEENFQLLVFIAYLISNLKNDFTGYKIPPMNILYIKINDMDTAKNQKIFEDAEKEVIKKIEKIKKIK